MMPVTLLDRPDLVLVDLTRLIDDVLCLDGNAALLVLL
jgi:hypothetical protein